MNKRIAIVGAGYTGLAVATELATSKFDADVKQFTQGLYKSFITLGFIFRTITSIRNFDDIIFILRAAKSVFGHLTDFKK